MCVQVVCDPLTGVVVKKNIFPTHALGYHGAEDVAAAFTQFLNTIETGMIVCVAVHGQGRRAACVCGRVSVLLWVGEGVGG